MAIFEKSTHRTYTKTQYIIVGNPCSYEHFTFQRRWLFLLLCCDSLGSILAKKTVLGVMDVNIKIFKGFSETSILTSLNIQNMDMKVSFTSFDFYPRQREGKSSGYMRNL